MLDEHKITVWICFGSQIFWEFLGDHGRSLGLSDLYSFHHIPRNVLSPAAPTGHVQCVGSVFSALQMDVCGDLFSVPCFSEGIHATVKCSWTVESNKSQFLRAGGKFRTHHPGK